MSFQHFEFRCFDFKFDSGVLILKIGIFISGRRRDDQDMVWNELENFGVK